MIGFGYDLHRLAEGETLILGGVQIPSDTGTVAHSDGDVLIHAICDAILGAAGMGDIGEHFPDTDEQYKNADSSKLLQDVLKMIREEALEIVNIDSTIILEKPKLKQYKIKITENLAMICSLGRERINIKATTNEKTGPVGRGEAIAVYSVCMLKEK